MFVSKWTKISGLVLGSVFVIIFLYGSIVLGYTKTTFSMVVDAYTHFNGSNEHLIIKTSRVPRAFIAAAVGASLAVAGALMQALTRNPLASPSILGVNAGAGFFVVIAVTFFSVTSIGAFTWISFLGAALASIVVYFLGSVGREGLTPLKLTLAGAAMAALFSSMTQGMLAINEQALDQVLFWLAGSIEGRNLDNLTHVLPYFLVAWMMAIAVSKSVNILLLGEDVAKGLGQRTLWVKLVVAVIVVFLAGGSVAVAGPIGFIGLVVPHFARVLVGTDHRWVIPYCALLGAILLLAADIGARYIIMPKEVPVGVMTALIGAPFFIFIARRGFRK